MRSEQEITRAITRHADTVRRICLLHLKNASDTEDVFQEVFLKYALSTVAFDSEEHEKAWLIRVTINQCKDVLKSFFRRNAVSLDGLLPAAVKQEPQDTHSSEITYAIIIYLLVNVHVLVRSEPYRYFNTFARNIQVKSLYFFLLSLAKNKERDYNEKYL